MEWRNGIRVGAESCRRRGPDDKIQPNLKAGLMDGSDWFPLADDMDIYGISGMHSPLRHRTCLTALSRSRPRGFCCSLATSSAVAERFSDF
jgi:hypothetical protein